MTAKLPLKLWNKFPSRTNISPFHCHRLAVPFWPFCEAAWKYHLSSPKPQQLGQRCTVSLQKHLQLDNHPSRSQSLAVKSKMGKVQVDSLKSKITLKSLLKWGNISFINHRDKVMIVYLHLLHTHKKHYCTTYLNFAECITLKSAVMLADKGKFFDISRCSSLTC